MGNKVVYTNTLLEDFYESSEPILIHFFSTIHFNNLTHYSLPKVYRLGQLLNKIDSVYSIDGLKPSYGYGEASKSMAGAYLLLEKEFKQRRHE